MLSSLSWREKFYRFCSSEMTSVILPAPAPALGQAFCLGFGIFFFCFCGVSDFLLGLFCLFWFFKTV